MKIKKKALQEKRKTVALRVIFCLFMTVWIGLLGGCSLKKDKAEGKNLEFLVMSKEVLPTEVRSEIEAKGTEKFSFTYVQGEDLYICIGYGPQKGQGYSICVDECTLMEDGIYVNTTLLGPDNNEKRPSGISYPYIVIKTEYYNLPVIVQ